jgi:hypothetical protein
VFVTLVNLLKAIESQRYRVDDNERRIDLLLCGREEEDIKCTK